MAIDRDGFRTTKVQCWKREKCARFQFQGFLTCKRTERAYFHLKTIVKFSRSCTLLIGSFLSTAYASFDLAEGSHVAPKEEMLLGACLRRDAFTLVVDDAGEEGVHGKVCGRRENWARGRLAHFEAARHGGPWATRVTRERPTIPV